MITFTFLKEKRFIEVKKDGVELPQTMIKAADVTADEQIVELCKNWLDAFGLFDQEYHIDKRLV